MDLGAIAVAAMVFAPSHLPGIAAEIRSGDMVVMALVCWPRSDKHRGLFGAPHAAEPALRVVDAGIGVRIFDGVIDAPGVEMRMQVIPSGGLIGVHRCAAIEAGFDEAHRGACLAAISKHRAVLAGHDGSERPPRLSASDGTLTDQHHALTLIIAVLKPGGGPCDRPSCSQAGHARRNKRRRPRRRDPRRRCAPPSSPCPLPRGSCVPARRRSCPVLKQRSGRTNRN